MRQPKRPLPDLNDTEKLELAREVFDTVCNETLKFRENNLGANLASLMGAIVGFEHSFVDWDLDGCSQTLSLFVRIFPANHQVWNYILYTE